MKSEIQQRLEQLAIQRTNAFCYSCYKTVTALHCPSCGSDDFMREIPEVGVEYGTDWVIRQILTEELEPVDVDAAFEEMVREVYPEEVTVGWMTLDTVSVMKEMDPTSWRIAVQEWIENEEQEGNIMVFDGGNNYYRVSDLEQLLREEGL
ncbi:hypothetical protein [Bdellovibrio sp.]|uniref:hypothetical protein n=1 Tax=Bdellovibrio sp. TaxID=28201 RepID=UPI0039E64E1C